MANNPTLHATVRQVRGKAVRHMRREGSTPVVLYGSKTGSLPLQVDTKELLGVLAQAGGTHLVAIKVEGEKKPRMALAREVQRHVTRLTPLHADFLEVDVRHKVTSQVPLAIDGEPELARRGVAIVNHLVNSVTVEALPTDIPYSIHVDTGPLVEVDDAIRVRDLVVPSNLRILDDPDDVVLRLSPTRRAYLDEEAEATVAAPAVELEGEEQKG